MFFFCFSFFCGLWLQPYIRERFEQEIWTMERKDSEHLYDLVILVYHPGPLRCLLRNRCAVKWKLQDTQRYFIACTNYEVSCLTYIAGRYCKCCVKICRFFGILKNCLLHIPLWFFYVRSIDSKVKSELICARSAAISTSLDLVHTIAFFALQRVFKCKYLSPRHKVANKWLFCLNYPWNIT